jgi:hypothetical protein
MGLGPRLEARDPLREIPAPCIKEPRVHDMQRCLVQSGTLPAIARSTHFPRPSARGTTALGCRSIEQRVWRFSGKSTSTSHHPPDLLVNCPPTQIFRRLLQAVLHVLCVVSYRLVDRDRVALAASGALLRGNGEMQRESSPLLHQKLHVLG